VSPNPRKATAKLLAAVSDEDSSEYADAYETLLELKSRQADLDLRPLPAHQARKRRARPWAGRHPAIALAFMGAVSPPPRPGRGMERGASSTTSSTVAPVSHSKRFNQKAKKLGEQLRRSTVGLIDKRAWSCPGSSHIFLAKRPGACRVARYNFGRIGKGHGIRVSLLRAEATRKMSECRGAVPCLGDATFQSGREFRSALPTRFDVVIIDEASQSDVMAPRSAVPWQDCSRRR